MSIAQITSEMVAMMTTYRRNQRVTMKAGISTTAIQSHRIRTLIVALCLLGWPAIASSQTYTLAPFPPTILNNSGNIINGGCIWTYLTGTSTAATTYSTQNGTANANPIIADSSGRYVAYLTPGTTYRFVYENIPCSASSHGTVLRTVDGIAAVPVSGLNVDVTVTAGATLAAGEVAYISDGSGGNNAGQAYLADADTLYSSTTAVTIGLATAAISATGTGTIRTTGRVTGLTGLTAGDIYYASATAGALTATPPTNARCIGKADTTTSLIVPCGESALGHFRPPQGRCTLTTAVPVTTADVTAATTLYYALYGGNQITLYDGSERWVQMSFAQLSIAVPATTNQMYDVFVDYTAGVPALEVVAWTNDTTRATALATQNGVYVQTSDTDSLYVCSFRTTGVSGQTEDSFAKRFVWNYYNRVPRAVRVIEATDTWTYSDATVRQANGSTANQVAVVVGVAEVPITLRLLVAATDGLAGTNLLVQIGYDSTTAGVANQLKGFGATYVANLYQQLVATLVHYPAVGYHIYTWLEYSDGTNTTTWYGDNGGTAIQSGLDGDIEG